MNLYPAQTDASGRRFAIVVSRFNEFLTAKLLDACVETLTSRGALSDEIDAVWVPGAFEIPQAASILAASGRYDAVVALGAVIRGETPHFDYVCDAVTDGIREIIRETGVPVAFGILTTDDRQQALARAGGEVGNKGIEAAEAAIEMAGIRARLSKPPEAPR